MIPLLVGILLVLVALLLGAAGLGAWWAYRANRRLQALATDIEAARASAQSVEPLLKLARELGPRVKKVEESIRTVALKTGLGVE